MKVVVPGFAQLKLQRQRFIGNRQAGPGLSILLQLGSRGFRQQRQHAVPKNGGIGSSRSPFPYFLAGI